MKITCEEYDFSALAKAMDGEYSSDCDLSAEIVFMDKSDIKELNARTRNVDSATDVLSFPSLDGIFGREIIAREHPCETDESGAVFIGSVVICTQVAKEQAESFGHGYDRELYYLAVHGLCHLLGYDHTEEDDKRLMRTKEERILSKLGLSMV